MQLLPNVDEVCYQPLGEGQEVINRSLTLFELDFMRVLNRHLDNARQSAQASDSLIYANKNLTVDYIIDTRRSGLDSDEV